MAVSATKSMVKKHYALVGLAVRPDPQITLCASSEATIKFHIPMLVIEQRPLLWGRSIVVSGKTPRSQLSAD